MASAFYNGLEKCKTHWAHILLSLLAFSFIAWLFNYLINALAYETCFYLSLKTRGILSATASEWTVLLFFKNLSVIPFTLVFEALLLLWLTNTISALRETGLETGQGIGRF